MASLGWGAVPPAPRWCCLGPPAGGAVPPANAAPPNQSRGASSRCEWSARCGRRPGHRPAALRWLLPCIPPGRRHGWETACGGNPSTAGRRFANLGSFGFEMSVSPCWRWVSLLNRSHACAGGRVHRERARTHTPTPSRHHTHPITITPSHPHTHTHLHRVDPLKEGRKGTAHRSLVCAQQHTGSGQGGGCRPAAQPTPNG